MERGTLPRDPATWTRASRGRLDAGRSSGDQRIAVIPWKQGH
jgi:hypothetical protein